MKSRNHLMGTVTSFVDNRGHITADDGDWYEFRSKRKFREGDRVSFDVALTGNNLAVAMMGVPISCLNVKHIKA